MKELNGKYMLHPIDEDEAMARKGVMTIRDKPQDLTPFEVDVIGVQEMSFRYFATATISPGESHYRSYTAMGAFCKRPGGDGTIFTVPLSQLKIIKLKSGDEL